MQIFDFQKNLYNYKLFINKIFYYFQFFLYGKKHKSKWILNFFNIVKKS